MRSNWRWKCAQYVERIWWKNYLRKKEIGTYLNWKKNYWTNMLSECLPYLQLTAPAEILDAGCGPAGIFMVLDGNKVQAFDPLLAYYEANLPHFSRARYPWVEFTASSLETFSPSTSFDVVFCMNAINHVNDIGLSFDRLVSFGHPGSYFVMTIDAHNYRLLKTIFTLLPGDILHPHQYLLGDYQRMFTSRDCRILLSKRIRHDLLFDHYLLIAQKKGAKATGRPTIAG